MGNKVLTYDSTIKDKLISFNGSSISYDANNPFNPYSYMNYTYTFQGRRLTRWAKGSGYTAYYYNDKGLRVQKAISNGKITNYEYDGNKLIYENGPLARLDFLYDENGELYGFIKDSTDKYFYIRDCLKNILGIVDINGNIVVKYNYNAFGVHSITYDNSGIDLGNINPFRFKGYYYDSESEMYYCQSRYYVPEWGRWLNADSPAFLDFNSLNGMNLYAYCGNDPVNAVDESGCIATTALVIAILAVCTLAGGISGGAVSYENATKKGYSGNNLVWQTVRGAIIGAGVGLAIGGFIVSSWAIVEQLTAATIGIAAMKELTTVQVFAIGALAVDISAFVIFPAFGIEMEGIEVDTSNGTDVPKPNEYRPPKGIFENIGIAIYF